jgi:hypothetical protein
VTGGEFAPAMQRNATAATISALRIIATVHIGL